MTLLHCTSSFMYIDEVMPLNDILKSVRHNICRMIFTLRVYVNNMLCFHDLHEKTTCCTRFAKKNRHRENNWACIASYVCTHSSLYLWEVCCAAGWVLPQRKSSSESEENECCSEYLTLFTYNDFADPNTCRASLGLFRKTEAERKRLHVYCGPR